MKPIPDELTGLEAVKKVLDQGYMIEYEFDDSLHAIRFQAKLRRFPVGSAAFYFSNESRTGHMERIAVYEGHRRKGIADAMMVCAKCLTKCEPVPAISQTAEGRAWWNRPNLPWRGNDVCDPAALAGGTRP